MKDLEPLELSETFSSVFKKLVAPREPLPPQPFAEPLRDSVLGELRAEASDWSFRMPVRLGDSYFHFKRILTETDLQLLERVHFGQGRNDRSEHGMNASETLDHLSEMLAKLRQHVLSEVAQDRQSSIYYATVLQHLCQACQNNVTSFVYEGDYEMDSMLFEYIHALIATMARVYQRAVSLQNTWDDLAASVDEMNNLPAGDMARRTCEIQTTTVWRQQQRYFNFCIELLQALYEACQKARQPPTADRFLYVLSPETLSSSQAGFDRQAVSTEKLSADAGHLVRFIDHYVGGERQIKAHVHYMKARCYEAQYHDVTAQVNRSRDDGDAMQRLPPIAQAIVVEYTNARNDALYLGETSLFWQVMRFRAHYWFCALHLTVARLESRRFRVSLTETATDDPEEAVYALENAQCALVRLHHISAQDKAFGKLHADLNRPMCQQYAALMMEVSALYEQLDQEIYVKRQLAPSIVFEELPAIECPAYKKIDQHLQRIMDTLFTNDKRRALSFAVNFLEVICGQYYTERNAQPRPESEPEQQQEPEFREEEPKSECMPILTRNNECKVELLTERLHFLQWMLRFYNEEGQLEVDTQWLYELLQRELPKTEERLAMVRK